MKKATQKTKLLIKSLDDVYNLPVTQASLQDLVNRYVWSNRKEDNYQKITFDIEENFWDSLLEKLVDDMGGYKKYRPSLKASIKFRAPKHWALDRFFVEKINDRVYMSYCVGQDQTTEMRYLREYLRNI